MKLSSPILAAITIWMLTLSGAFADKVDVKIKFRFTNQGEKSILGVEPGETGKGEIKFDVHTERGYQDIVVLNLDGTPIPITSKQLMVFEASALDDFKAKIGDKKFSPSNLIPSGQVFRDVKSGREIDPVVAFVNAPMRKGATPKLTFALSDSTFIAASGYLQFGGSGAAFMHDGKGMILTADEKAGGHWTELEVELD